MSLENKKENTRYFKTREEWRKWLKKNFDKEKEIWFVFPNKSTGKQSVLYNDAVEEALCFGWIDSIIRSLDPEHKIQRFTPRRLNSSYSQPNKERLRWLFERKLIHPDIEKQIMNIIEEDFLFPEDILARIKEQKPAWANFQKFSGPYKRIRIAYIDGARLRTEEFEKRLKNFIEKTKENKLIGYGGIDKYF